MRRMLPNSNDNPTRKRSNRSEVATNEKPAKRQRHNSEKASKNNNGHKSFDGSKRKKKGSGQTKKGRRNRIRRRTSGMKSTLCELFEQALVDSPSLPPIYHLFKTTDSSGTPRASLVELLKTLQVSKIVRNTHFLTHDHWKSISNFTDLFIIEEDEIGCGLFLKYRPVYDSKECTVYIDNLPEGCGREKLLRLAKCYGNVAEVKLAVKPKRMIKPITKKPTTPGKPSTSGCNDQQKFINVGSRPKSFGFIRFVRPESAQKLINAFQLNDPSLPYEIAEERGDVITRHTPFNNLYVMRLVNEIKRLRMRKKRRKVSQYYRLAKLRGRLALFLRKEYKCRMIERRNAGLYIKPKMKKKNKNIPRYSFSSKDRNIRSDLNNQNANSKSNSKRQNSNGKKKFGNGTKKLVKTNKNGKKEKAKKCEEENENGDEKKVKKRRRRRNKSRKAPDYIQGGSVSNYFRDVQVLSLEKYQQLKKEYLELIDNERKNVGQI